MSRTRGPRPRRGGRENKHSRSLAVVLEYVRTDFERSTLEELDEHFRSMDVDKECFGFLESVTEKNDSEPGKRISTYENATRYPQWGTMVRYGVVAQTWPGVLLLVSGFYAFLRDAAKETGELSERELVAADTMARKTIAMCVHAQSMIATFNDEGGLRERLWCKDGDEWKDEATRSAHAQSVIGSLLNAYRNA